VLTTAVGLTFAFVGIDAMEASNACLASPARSPYASGLGVSGFGILFAVGVSLILIGALDVLRYFGVTSKVRPYRTPRLSRDQCADPACRRPVSAPRPPS
jgi:hypothetical protein